MKECGFRMWPVGLEYSLIKGGGFIKEDGHQINRRVMVMNIIMMDHIMKVIMRKDSNHDKVD